MTFRTVSKAAIPNRSHLSQTFFCSILIIPLCIRTATTARAIWRTAIMVAAVFSDNSATMKSRANTTIATVAIFPYVLSFPHLAETFSLILSAKDFGGSFWFWKSCTCSSNEIGGISSSDTFSCFGGISTLFPQYEQNLVSSESSAPHFEHLISHISFIFPMKGSAA